jgi:hypothetical protein
VNFHNNAIFEKHGEIYFRKVETKFYQLLNSPGINYGWAEERLVMPIIMSFKSR